MIFSKSLAISFFLCAAILAILRMVGYTQFVAEVEIIETNFLAKEIFMFLLGASEWLCAYIILSRESVKKCVVLAIATQSFFIVFIPENAVPVTCVILLFFVPFVLADQNEEKSILCSFLFVVFVSGYQFLLMYSRYIIDKTIQFNFSYILFSMIETKVFLAGIACAAKAKRKEVKNVG